MWHALGAAVAGDASTAARMLLELEAGQSQQALEMILCAYALMLLEVVELEDDCRSAEVMLAPTVGAGLACIFGPGLIWRGETTDRSAA
jgi:hypothetical protein